MPTTPHTTLLEILSRPVTGDASGIHDGGEKVIIPSLFEAKKRVLDV
jgi:hypothetical protein